MFSPSEEHDHNTLVVRANVIACIHTVRNAYDHLAQLLNALLLTPPLPIKDCDFHKVRKLLPQSDLRQELDTLSESPWFKYVAAYSNTSKHRSLVQQSLHLSFADGIAGLRAEGFEHGEAYSAYMVGDLLDGILEVKNRIIDFGLVLNSQVLPANG